MNIGVALSGCDIGGIGAHSVLRELEEQGLAVKMVSACGLASMTALLYGYGYDDQRFQRSAETFLQHTREIDMDMAVAELAAELPLHRLERKLPLILSSVNVSDGGICAFTNAFSMSTRRLQTFSLDDPYDALSACISPVDGLASYSYARRELCDFSVWYGCPVYPLKMAGLDKIVSIAFVPRHPRTPYEVLVKQRITASSHLADIHIPIELDEEDGELWQYIETAAREVAGHISEICTKTLFYSERT